MFFCQITYYWVEFTNVIRFILRYVIQSSYDKGYNVLRSSRDLSQVDSQKLTYTLTGFCHKTGQKIIILCFVNLRTGVRLSWDEKCLIRSFVNTAQVYVSQKAVGSKWRPKLWFILPKNTDTRLNFAELFQQTSGFLKNLPPTHIYPSAIMYTWQDWSDSLL